MKSSGFGIIELGKKSCGRSAFMSETKSYERIPFEVKRTLPNAKTTEALAEYEAMKKNHARYKRYNSFAELMDEVFEDA